MKVKPAGSFVSPSGLAMALALFAFSGAALAESTTWTSISVEGPVIPGKSVMLVVQVTGKHLVYEPGPNAFGGNINIYVNGELITKNMAVVAWSTGITRKNDSGCGCTLIFADSTIQRFPYVLPAGQKQYTFSARYGGDNESHSSDSAALVRNAQTPLSPAVLQLLSN